MHIINPSLLVVLFTLTFSPLTFADKNMVQNDFKLSDESQLTENFNNKINNFWEKKAKRTYLFTDDNKKLSTFSIKTGNNKAIVISQGRTESALKYKEVAYDLNLQGYDLYLIDHRGQGDSERLLNDKHKGHIVKFQDYINDFNQYIVSLELKKHYQKNYLLSHSMGGTISALYLEEYKNPFQAAVFISPMLSINLGGIPEVFAKTITSSASKLCTLFSSQACYIFGGGDFKKEPFIDNKLTSSKKRYLSSLNTFEQNPKTQLGSPTINWVSESITAAQKARNEASKITIPILIFQAGSDSIVTPKGQELFYSNLTKRDLNKLIKIPGAKHEILFEGDEYRDYALSKALQFLNKFKQEELSCKK